MKYNVGDKVRIKSLDWYNENKDEDGIVELSTHVFVPEMSQFCGKVVTIGDVFEDIDDNVVYYIEEIDWDWTDEMFEGLVEEKTKPNFKVGDEVIAYVEGCIAKFSIKGVRWNNELNKFEYKICSSWYDASIIMKLYKKADNMEAETHRGYYTTDVETTNESKKVAWFTFWDNDFADKVELDLSNRELIQEDGKWFVVKKEKKYPKTYEECCKVIGINRHDVEIDLPQPYQQKMFNLFKLLICRDAYWKIAGEKIGLGKPWEPDWEDESDKFTIGYFYNGIDTNIIRNYESHPLAFPTKEMRDAFYENFKDLIDKCKELL